MSANHRHNPGADLCWAAWLAVFFSSDEIWVSKLQPLLMRTDILCPGVGHTVTYAVILKNCRFMHLMKTKLLDIPVNITKIDFPVKLL